ncbi:Eukaryotic/viral aspartic protease, active site [Phytophthora palmivora]|uniref:Eukaryotic/viral aspartic protease, active site n=1 Tax=Phytophthora palmivora TaxID=4796 RepID=A0A2P4XKB2_9STRA|nr:Eukaryotic/viral aspartic protease, active site [Phytophthora palmivora]
MPLEGVSILSLLVRLSQIQDTGKCPMGEFYSLIRLWYVPTKHTGMLPNARQVGIWCESSVLNCKFSYVKKKAGLMVSKLTKDRHTIHVNCMGNPPCRFREYHVLGKLFVQAKAMGKINNERTILLFAYGTESD